jgi:hypothetical protein
MVWAVRLELPARSGLIAVLYGAPTLRTCLLELLLPWKAASGANAVLAAIPEPTDEAEAVDAARDHALAIESRRVAFRRCCTTGSRSKSVPIPRSRCSIFAAYLSGSGSRKRLLSRTNCAAGASRSSIAERC